MEALIYNFATESHKEEAKQFVKDHKDDLRQMLESQELKALMIEASKSIDNYSMFEKYKSNTVTDGQAYISLTDTEGCTNLLRHGPMKWSKPIRR